MVIDFEIKGEKYSLYFGMLATEIIGNMAFEAVASKDTGNIKMFAIVVYGGLCNRAEMSLKSKPSFEEAYLLTNEILQQPEELQSKIYSAWHDSEPNKRLQDILNKGKKKVDQERGKKQIGS